MRVQMVNVRGSVDIDGRTFTGRNISINGDRVVVDGVEQDGQLVGNISITVNGDVESIASGSGDIKAQSVGKVSTGSGDVECGDVSGSVTTGSGDIKCGRISGSASTMSGDIISR